MGTHKTMEMRHAKRLAKIQERKLMEQEQSERDETKRPEKIIRRPSNTVDIVNLNSQGLRQKKG